LKKILYYVSVLFIASLIISCEDNLNSPIHTNPDLKANSKVLIELFSNVMCVACVQSANYCDEITSLRGVTINDTNVIAINIHTSLFPGDPFYGFNSNMNSVREDYYNVLFNPAGYLMGSLMTSPFSTEQWTNQINQRLNKTNSISIILNNTIDTISRAGTLNITAGQVDGQSLSNLKLYAVVTESNLYFNSPNGKTNYNNILRQMLNGYSGEDIIISPGQPVNLVKEYTIDNRIIFKNSQIIVFLQNNLTKEVLGATKINL
jgi:hypothetical protein